jgi:hypothetical protein
VLDGVIEKGDTVDRIRGDIDCAIIHETSSIKTVEVGKELILESFSGYRITYKPTRLIR